MQAQPKQRPKPSGSVAFPREVASRPAETRQEIRASLNAAGLQESPDLPWDVRGPTGPEDGGPRIYKKQRFREGSQRWANAGGKHREKFTVYAKKKQEGLRGADLAHYHPYAKGGFWERFALAEGTEPPWKEREERGMDHTRIQSDDA